MRQEFYGMRRADGDWFALGVGGESRVPIFRSSEGAWRARTQNPELLLFRPAPLDERALEDLATADGGRPAAFLVVDEDDPAANLTRGHNLDFEQLAILEGASRLPRPRTFEQPPLQDGGLGWAARAA
jgi:hypothetical protein